MTGPKDQVFKDKNRKIEPFAFNREVATVFDDMARRSIPFYNKVQDLTARYIVESFKKPFRVYDLGCSTGNTYMALRKYLSEKDFQWIGIDQSDDMLEICQNKIKASNVALIGSDIEGAEIENADVVIMNYTLQFIAPEKREGILKNIFSHMNSGGVLLLSEKVVAEDREIDELLVRIYYELKRENGYDEVEIGQKRKALENVLIPKTPKENEEMLKAAGFKRVDTIFRWCNFLSMVAIKD